MHQTLSILTSSCTVASMGHGQRGSGVSKPTNSPSAGLGQTDPWTRVPRGIAVKSRQEGQDPPDQTVDPLVVWWQRHEQ